MKENKVIKEKISGDIAKLFAEANLKYEENAAWKLSACARDFIIRSLNDAYDLKTGNCIKSEDIRLTMTLEAENRLATYQPLKYNELVEIGTVYNRKELPEIRNKYGLRIPSDNLTRANYKLKNKPKVQSNFTKDTTYRKQSYYNKMPYNLITKPQQLQMKFPMRTLQINPQINPCIQPLQHYQQFPQHVYMPATVNFNPDLKMAPQRLVFRPKLNIQGNGKENQNK